MIAGDAVFYIDPAMKGPKRNLAEAIGRQCGAVVRSPETLAKVPEHLVPVVGCHVEIAAIVRRWRETKRPFVYRDRGYLGRGTNAVTALRHSPGEGYWRWQRDGFQLARLLPDPTDRLRRLGIELRPWSRDGNHVVVAAPAPGYAAFHALGNWNDRIVERLRSLTRRPIFVRLKSDKRPLVEVIGGAHALVTHGSNAAVEAAILGCPVFVDPSSAAAMVGRIDLGQIEDPIYPARDAWLHALAAAQWNEAEQRAGAMWKHL